MASFVGSAVIVTLKQGPVIQGFVHAVDPTSASLMLQDAFLPNTGQRIGAFTAQGPAIADLRVVEAPPPSHPPAPSSNRGSIASTVTPLNVSSQQAPTRPQIQHDTFEDPAIVSYARKPGANASNGPRQMPAVTQTAPTLAKQEFQPKPEVARAGTYRDVASAGLGGKQKLQPPHRAATLQGAFNNLELKAEAAAAQEPFSETDGPFVPHGSVRRVSITKTRTGKPMDDDAGVNGEGAKRRGTTRRKKKDVTQAANEAEASPRPDISRAASTQYKGKGWRQTPILQDSSPQRSQQNKNSVRRSKKQQALDKEAANNGWATEDATDVQEMGEFDFVGNLSKFDKKSVFDQIRTEDTTADEDRLVFSNKARPGTYGGKNFHPTENVLDSPKVAPRLSNHETDSDEGFDVGSGRSKRRINSRASSRRPPHRVGSGVLDDSGSLKDLGRSNRALRAPYAGSSSHGPGGSPNPQRYTPPESPAGSQTLGAHFRVVTTDRACPTIMPAGMAAIEEVAETEFGLSTDIMTENAGRGIAEVAMATMNANSLRRKDSATKDTRPWALIIAGNHKLGARALAACRHLRSRNIRTLTCLLGFDRQTVELEREVRKQADILVKMNGYVRGWTEAKNYLTREGQPDLIVDALMSSSKPFDVLALEDQKAVVDIVGWSKRLNPARDVTLSIDMPCGINGSTGDPSVIDPTTAIPLQISTNHIVCIGAPRIGLLRALQKITLTKNIPSMANASQFSPELLNAQIWVVDIGVEKAWKRSGLAGSRGVKFGDDWVVPVKLVEGLAEDGR